MLYLLNSDSSVTKCLSMIESVDSVIVFADKELNESLLYELCKKSTAVKIVDNTYTFSADDYDMTQDKNFMALEVNLHRVKSREAAMFLAQYKGRIISLM